jgi:short-subunit dehydrogenase
MSRSVALVVGGSSGMGKYTAKRLLARGNTVILLSRQESSLAITKQGLEWLVEGGIVETVSVDLYDQSITSR